MNKVVMYSKDYCPYCARAKALLEQRGVADLEIIQIDRDPAQRDIMIERTGRRTVPQIFIGDTHVGGCDDLMALDRAGGLAPCSTADPLIFLPLLPTETLMADQNQNTQQEGGNDAPSFNLQRVYLKDLSLEMPNAPHVFLEQEAPQVEVSIAVGGQRLADTVFETTVTVTVTTRINDKVVYLVEGTQAGIFEAANIPEEQLDPLLGIVCPTMLYPYLRANIADAITRTSMPRCT